MMRKSTLVSICSTSALLTWVIILIVSTNTAPSKAFTTVVEKIFPLSPRLQRLQSGLCQQNQRTNDDGNMSGSDEGNGEEKLGQMYGGLVFLKTRDRRTMIDFYKSRIGMVDWLEQPNITILQHGNMILGFHQPQQEQSPDLSGMYTFVYPTRQQVDEMYSKLQDIADGPPRVNDVYQIYQFFANDPEGRNLEFQVFLHPLPVVTSKP